MRLRRTVLPAVAAGVLGASGAFASPNSMKLTAATATPRCSVTPRVPFTVDGGSAIDASAILKCRTQEKR